MGAWFGRTRNPLSVCYQILRSTRINKVPGSATGSPHPSPAAKNGYTNLMPTSFILLKRAMFRRRGVTLSTTDAARSGPAS